MLPSDAAFIGSEPCNASAIWESFVFTFQRQETSFITTDEIDGMSIIWLSLRDRGIPQQTARTIIASWRDSSKKQYLASIRQWGRFCVIRKIHPCSASVLDGLNFLQYLFNLSVSYSSINTARSALSFILPRNDCGSFGQHFLVKKFVRGVYNLRTQLRNTVIFGTFRLYWNFLDTCLRTICCLSDCYHLN